MNAPGPLARIPVFVPAGAMIPTTDSSDMRLRHNEPSRALRIYPARGRATSTFILYEDDGHTLAFADPNLSTHQVIRTVSTNHPGTDLLADSRPVFSVPAGCSSPLMTSDGQAVICGNGESHPGCVNPPPELTVYSVATGKPERVLYRYRGGCSFGFAQVVWAKSGTLAIGDIEISKSVDLLPPTTNIVGVVTPNKFTSLPVTLVGEGYSSGRIAF